jgi:hypothetical protein
MSFAGEIADASAMLLKQILLTIDCSNEMKVSEARPPPPLFQE